MFRVRASIDEDKIEDVSKLTVVICTTPERTLYLQSVIGNIVGLFNENLGRFGKHLLSGEETELFNRIQKYMGLKVVLDDSVKVYHLIHGRKWKYVLGRAFMEGVSKAKFKNYSYSAEKSYLKRYLRDFPTGWLISGATILGFAVGKLVTKGY